MLKLMIADDERVIRETISTIIDWKQYDIELVGLCKNGLEAYDAILDESPDIVLTDIRMPGMDAMELLEKCAELDFPPHFILLSGYGEFEYAKKAMKYGVRHYLLKPCNKNQILESIQDVARTCLQETVKQHLEQDSFRIANNMVHNAMFGILNDALYQNHSYEDIFRAYEPFLDFHFSHYQLVYVYYLEETCLRSFLSDLKIWWEQHMPFTTLHGVYTRNTLILFAKDCGEQNPVFQEFLEFLSSLSVSGQTACQEIQTASFPDLAQLLPVILNKVRRYNMICYIHNFHVIATCNYGLLSAELECLASQLFGNNNQELAPLLETINNVQDLQFLKQSVSSLLLKLGSSNLGYTAADLTDFLMEINQEKSLDNLKKKVCQYFVNMKKNHDHQGSQPVSAMVLRIFQYVEEHISSPNLTLKSIAEQYLFMNTDYVSRKFQKETGEKFSSYLTSVRIRKAKEYLASSDAGKIQNVACMVGCGNNPQYFSQLFRKQTGMTPSAYVAKLHNTGT